MVLADAQVASGGSLQTESPDYVLISLERRWPAKPPASCWTFSSKAC